MQGALTSMNLCCMRGWCRCMYALVIFTAYNMQPLLVGVRVQIYIPPPSMTHVGEPLLDVLLDGSEAVRRQRGGR